MEAGPARGTSPSGLHIVCILDPLTRAAQRVSQVRVRVNAAQRVSQVRVRVRVNAAQRVSQVRVRTFIRVRMYVYVHALVCECECEWAWWWEEAMQRGSLPGACESLTRPVLLVHVCACVCVCVRACVCICVCAIRSGYPFEVQDLGRPASRLA